QAGALPRPPGPAHPLQGEEGRPDAIDLAVLHPRPPRQRPRRHRPSRQRDRPRTGHGRFQAHQGIEGGGTLRGLRHRSGPHPGRQGQAPATGYPLIGPPREAPAGGGAAGAARARPGVHAGHLPGANCRLAGTAAVAFPGSTPEARHCSPFRLPTREITMRLLAIGLFLGGLFAATTFTETQPPGGGKGGKGDKGGPGGPGGGGAKAMTVEELVTRMMTFDKNKDGKLTRDEITDERLLPLFDRADANKDGVVTKDELTALFTK